MTPADMPAHSTDELIALGRDREAVVAATRDRATRDATHPGGPMEGPDQLDRIMPLLRRIVDGMSPEQLDDPTPCARFTVAAVMEHMIAGASTFAPAFRGEAPTVSDASEGDIRARWRQAMADLTDAVHSDDALGRTIAAPFGEVSGSFFARYVAFDGLIHGWDLATATGQPYTPPETVVREADAFARQALGPDMRDGDTFAAETDAPADAGALERLVAFTGRQLRA
jgi:uncharacterized protein (TIGR03086 family)